MSGEKRVNSMTPIAGDPAAHARAKLRKLWQLGDLFHVVTRYPRKKTVTPVDRLSAILQSGIVAPGYCDDGTVISDLNLTVLHCEPPYETLVFLHRFGPQSWLYTICEPGRFAVFVDPTFAVMTTDEMGDYWPILCQDEVYVRNCVPVDHLIGVAIHPDDTESVLTEFLPEFQRLAIPLYNYNGNVLWPVCD
jgi:hypothetical protein